LRLVGLGRFLMVILIADLIKNQFQIEALAAFEPDLANFKKVIQIYTLPA